MAKKFKSNPKGPKYKNNPDPCTIILPDNCPDDERRLATAYVIANTKLDTKYTANGTKITTGDIPIGIIKYDKDVTRDTSRCKMKIGTPETPFDESKMETFTLSYHDGMYHMLNGGIKGKVAMENGVNMCHAIIIETSSIKEDANIVLQLEHSNKKRTNTQLYKLEMVAGNPYVLTLNDILGSYAIAYLNKITNSGRKIRNEPLVAFKRCAETIDHKHGMGDTTLAKAYIRWFLDMLVSTNWIIEDKISLSIWFIRAMSYIYEIICQENDSNVIAAYNAKLTDVFSKITPTNFMIYMQRRVNNERGSLGKTFEKTSVAREILSEIIGLKLGHVITEKDIRKLIK